MSVRGKIKWFNDEKGFGFISCNNGEPDVFVHFSAIRMPGRKTLVEGDNVEFDIAASDKGPKAVNVERV